ncbi:hypothetical protein ACCT32_34865, partial [Rhizobium brockwellii]
SSGLSMLSWLSSLPHRPAEKSALDRYRENSVQAAVEAVLTLSAEISDALLDRIGMITTAPVLPRSPLSNLKIRRVEGSKLINSNAFLRLLEAGRLGDAMEIYTNLL